MTEALRDLPDAEINQRITDLLQVLYERGRPLTETDFGAWHAGYSCRQQPSSFDLTRIDPNPELVALFTRLLMIFEKVVYPDAYVIAPTKP